MLKSIRLKFGRSPNSAPETIEISPVTVFVGPNNSGKSKLLQELNYSLNQGMFLADNKILEAIELNHLSEERKLNIIREYALTPNHGEYVAVGYIVFGKKGARNHVLGNQIHNILTNPNENLNNFAIYYLRHNTVFLGGYK